MGPFFEHGFHLNWTRRDPLAPLKISTTAGLEYFIKLVEPSTSRDAVGVFVEGGKYVETLVPLGTYELRYAIGQGWQDDITLFGEETSFVKAQAPLNFTETAEGYSGYQIELIPTTGGNLHKMRIERGQF